MVPAPELEATDIAGEGLAVTGGVGRLVSPEVSVAGEGRGAHTAHERPLWRTET